MVQRLFGTNGVRGVVNVDMNVQLAMDLGRAIGTFMGGRVAIGNDPRTSGWSRRRWCSSTSRPTACRAG